MLRVNLDPTRIGYLPDNFKLSQLCSSFDGCFFSSDPVELRGGKVSTPQNTTLSTQHSKMVVWKIRIKGAEHKHFQKTNQSDSGLDKEVNNYVS